MEKRRMRREGEGRARDGRKLMENHEGKDATRSVMKGEKRYGEGKREVFDQGKMDNYEERRKKRK